MSAVWTDALGQSGRSSHVNKLLDCLAHIKDAPATVEEIAAAVAVNEDAVRKYLSRAEDRGLVVRVVMHRRGRNAIAAQWRLKP